MAQLLRDHARRCTSLVQRCRRRPPSVDRRQRLCEPTRSERRTPTPRRAQPHHGRSWLRDILLKAGTETRSAAKCPQCAAGPVDASTGLIIAVRNGRTPLHSLIPWSGDFFKHCRNSHIPLIPVKYDGKIACWWRGGLVNTLEAFPRQSQNGICRSPAAVLSIGKRKFA